MRKRAGVIVVCIMLLIGAGIVVIAVSRARSAAQRVDCHNNLKSIGLAVLFFQDCHESRYPAGTYVNKELPPEKRLSWLAHLLPYMFSCGMDYRWDSPWDDPVNRQARAYGMDGTSFGFKGINLFRCPANSTELTEDGDGLGHYVGIAGIGVDAGTLPVGDRRVGFFGYDRRIRPEDVKDGLATTMMIAETATDNGPWLAGGPATVRGLDPERSPYLGGDGQFSSRHGARNEWRLWYPAATQVVFADGSVRVFTDSLASQLFEAMATIAGGEPLDRIGEE